MKVLLAGAVAGVAMFLWGGISHMVLPIGEMGMDVLPDEAAISAVLKEKLPKPGMYMFPGERDMAKFEALIRERPRGMLTYIPAGVPWSFGSSLGTQFVLEVLVCLGLAFLMNMVRSALPSIGSRILFAVLAGAIGTYWNLLSYWNWYSFPLAFVAGGLINVVVGCAIAGFIIGKMLR
ncbi:MAG: hypothetical protein U0Q16_11305 [Bryobacteraceae bacterium]